MVILAYFPYFICKDNNVACARDLLDGILDWIYIHNSRLEVIQHYSYSAHVTVHRYTRTRILSLH
jgi:hypothetical protein